MVFEIDRVKYAFRPEDARNLLLFAGIMGASCPFVLTFSAHDNKWLDEGPILYGRNSKAKESTEEKPLTDVSTGRVLLQERERGITPLSMSYRSK